jgi:pyruvate dehydrogenase E2 component (dihydrolipoamide acetyltransferase)
MAEAIRLGRMTDTMEEGQIAELHIKVGDTVKVGDALAEIETDKATLPLESFYAGEILHVAVKPGDTLKMGALIAVIGKKGESFDHLLQPATVEQTPAAEVTATTTEKAEIQAVAVTAVPSTAAESRIKISPLAKKMAQEKGIDINRVKGSGEDGRIVKRDLEKAAATAPSSAKVISTTESFREVKLSQMRKTIARRLTESKNTAPHFYLKMSVNMDACMDIRRQLIDGGGWKVSFNDLVIKATGLALQKHPEVNCSWLGESIRYNDHIHIGMAVAIEDGLMVPVIRFADQKSVFDLSTEARALAEKATAKKLSPDEMTGNTFTISNLGMFGIDEFTAIINPPDACILAVGGIQEIPVVSSGQIKTGHIMKLTLSCDHRAVDGAQGARFLQTLKKILENPAMLLV